MVTFLKSAQNSKLLGCKSWDQALMRKNNISKKRSFRFWFFLRRFQNKMIVFRKILTCSRPHFEIALIMAVLRLLFHEKYF